MQKWVYEHADHSIFYTPKIYDAWTEEWGRGCIIGYIVMERLQGDTFAQWLEAHKDDADIECMQKKILKAIQHLWGLPVPQGTFVGPLKNHAASDRFFGQCRAPRTFESVTELEDWLNDIMVKVNRGEPIKIRDQPRQLCHCDLTDSNIMIDGDSIMIIDWAYSGVYPFAFEEWSIYHQVKRFGIGQKIAEFLAKRLCDNKFSGTMRSFSYASAYIQFGVHYTPPGILTSHY
ncbi:hypothetical protein TWF694_003600 [Orbilia ellipsospora]|uniref:Aminoglycoside phosphotransferase domain-containing protein n=1 Tax=Orbilia ellipsospora TaxID=2528407 RepID=A0AAV9WYL1_9PEZI